MGKSLLDSRLQDYILSATLREPDILARLRQETSRQPLAVMQIAPDQGQLMQLLVRAIGARRTLEVGVFTGYSSLAVALALPEDGSIVACDISEEYTVIARRYWREAGVEHKIDLRIAPAIETLDQLCASGHGGSFDFAFIDADKPSYPAYFERCLELVRPGGLIAIDNTLQEGGVADPENKLPTVVLMREFNQMLLRDTRISLAMLPVADGLTLALKQH